MKQTLFIDIDGTIADSFPWWLSLYNVKNHKSVQMSQITKYDVSWLGGISEFYDDYRGVQPVAGACSAVSILSVYYNVVFVTVGHGRHWLERYTYVTDNNFIQVKDRSLLRGFALIDDYDKNIESFNGLGFLVKQPWNNGQSWEEIKEELLRYAKNDVADGVSVAFV